jgi:hypothetical protein
MPRPNGTRKTERSGDFGGTAKRQLIPLALSDNQQRMKVSRQSWQQASCELDNFGKFKRRTAAVIGANDYP